jgi:hypothetical protein
MVCAGNGTRALHCTHHKPELAWLHLAQGCSPFRLTRGCLQPAARLALGAGLGRDSNANGAMWRARPRFPSQLTAGAAPRRGSERARVGGSRGKEGGDALVRAHGLGCYAVCGAVCGGLPGGGWTTWIPVKGTLSPVRGTLCLFSRSVGCHDSAVRLHTRAPCQQLAQRLLEAQAQLPLQSPVARCAPLAKGRRVRSSPPTGLAVVIYRTLAQRHRGPMAGVIHVQGPRLAPVGPGPRGLRIRIVPGVDIVHAGAATRHAVVALQGEKQRAVHRLFHAAFGALYFLRGRASRQARASGAKVQGTAA